MHTVICCGVNISAVILLSLENNEKQIETLDDWALFMERQDNLAFYDNLF